MRKVRLTEGLGTAYAPNRPTNIAVSSSPKGPNIGTGTAVALKRAGINGALSTLGPCVQVTLYELAGNTPRLAITSYGRGGTIGMKQGGGATFGESIEIEPPTIVMLVAGRNRKPHSLVSRPTTTASISADAFRRKCNDSLSAFAESERRNIGVLSSAMVPLITLAMVMSSNAKVTGDLRQERAKQPYAARRPCRTTCYASPATRAHYASRPSTDTSLAELHSSRTALRPW